MSGRRIAIVGTAASWKQTPWNDPGLEIWGLNDAWTLGLPRVDAWFDLHPIDHFHYRKASDRVVYADDVPHGFYVRPQGHLDKLQEMARTIPVYLQNEPPKGWPVNAQRLPKEALEAEFGTYAASGPAFEVMLAMHLGASEIQVWGIHLETDHEYREQRPNFEYLLGVARGRGIKVIMAPQSPLLKHGWQYAYQPKPQVHPAKQVLIKVRHEQQQIGSALVGLSRFASKAAPLDRLRRLQAQEMDCLRALQQREPVVIRVGA